MDRFVPTRTVQYSDHYIQGNVTCRTQNSTTLVWLLYLIKLCGDQSPHVPKRSGGPDAMPAFALSFSNSWTAVLQASWVCRCTYYVVNNDFAIVSTYLMIFCVEGFTSLLTNASLHKNFFVKNRMLIILKFL